MALISAALRCGGALRPQVIPGQRTRVQPASARRPRHVSARDSLGDAASSSEFTAGAVDQLDRAALPPMDQAPASLLGSMQSRSTTAHSACTLSMQAAGAGDETAAVQWLEWLQFFQQADAAADRKEELSVELKDAVKREQYSEASRLKAELALVQQQDAVLQTLQEMQRALSEERYAEAAELRDGGLTGLQGWWAGQAEDDPVGHLLHITPEFSRWTGRVFRPRDLTDLKVNKPAIVASQGSLRVPQSTGSAPRPTGSPVLEVFVRPGADGRLVHQAVSLRLPSMGEHLGSRGLPQPQPQPSQRTGRLPTGQEPEPAASSNSSSTATTGSNSPAASRSFGPTVRLSVSIREDGTASIRQLPAQPLHSQSARGAWEAAEADESVRMMRWASPAAAAPAAAASSPAPSAESSAASCGVVEAIVVEPDLPDEVIDISSQNAMSSLDGEDHSVTIVQEQQAPSPSSSHHNFGNTAGRMGGSGGRGLSLGLDSRGRLGGSDDLGFVELAREPTRLEVVGRDMMLLHVPEHSLHAGSSSGGLGSQRGGTAVRSPPGRSSSSSSFSSAAASSSSAQQRASVQAPNLSLLRRSEDPSALEEGSVSSFEVIIPLVPPPPAASSGEEGELKAPSEAVAAETLNILADQLALSMEAKVGHAAPREEIAEALREMVRRAASGETSSSVDVVLSSHGGTSQSSSTSGSGSRSARLVASAASAASEPATAADKNSAHRAVTASITYKRLSLDHPKTDPLCGLFLGSFGPHGPELLQLMRFTADGEEMVQAVKVTGDANVPAGSVSFRAKVGRKHRLDARDVYPDELGIMARYKGEGRVANKAFTQPRWVEGELLVFNSKGGPLTGGAQLGFVWAVPGEKRFLILLNRVDLKDVGAPKHH